MRKNIITITLLFVSAVLTIAQDMNIDVSLRRPVPIALAVWRLDPSVVTIRLTAQRDINNFVLAFEVRNNTTGQSARTRNEHPCMPVFSMRRGETRIINGPALICNNAIDASDELQRSIANAGAIPEGDYSFCVRVLESDRRTQLTTTGRDCDYFNVVWFEQPQLIRPIDPTIAENCQNAIIFNWVGVTPVPIGIVPQYRLRIVGVVEGQEPRVALEAGTPSEVVFDQVIPTTSYTLPPNYPQLVDLANRASPRITRFAWQVQALDDRRVFIPTRGNTQGKSDIGVFTANCTRPSSADCMSPMTLSAFFPSANDTIPWMPPHLIVQWGPYCPQVKEFNYTLDVTEVGAGALPSNSRTLNWRSGIIEAQGLRGQPNAEERARLLITNWRNDAGGVASMNSQWRRGSSYEWRVSASITREESGSDRIRSVSTPTNRFAFGLRMPNNPEPSDGSTVADGSSMALRWDIPAPINTMYTPNDLLNVFGRSGASMDFGAAQEVIRVVVSRRRDMTTPVASNTIELPRVDIFRTGDDVNRFFGRKAFENLSFADTGWYYWRVQYCDPADTSRTYREGPVWSFRINTGTAPIDPSTCLRINPVAPENRSTFSGDSLMRFSVSTQPLVNISAIRGGRLRVWRMSGSGEDPTAVKARTPVLDANFTGNESANIIASPGIGSSSSRSYFNLPFVNTPGARFSFAAQPNTSYLWVFTLQFDGATIRRDGTRCSITEQSSSDGVFTYRSGGCVDNCLKPAPSNTTPAARTFSIGDEVTVGHFRARLTRVSGTGASLSGEATVNIPVFRGGMQVEFSNVQVNELGEMFGGEMRGKMAPEVPVSGTVANALTGGLGLTGPQVRSIHELASDGRRLVSGLIEGSSMTLPIGFDRVIEGQRVVVGVMGMVFKPTDARMNVVLSFPMPAFGPGERIGFGARNICFYPNGIGRDVDIGLVDDLGYTASDTSWSFHFLAPREAAAGVRADSGTFARFGCNGFEFIRLKAEVAFPRTWMKKVDPGSGAVVEGEHVKAQFTTLIRASGDFIAEATMDRFTPAGAPDFVMQVDTVTFDFSEADNPRSLVFPARYRGTTGNAWKGFFINRVYCKFPDQLRTFDTDRPLNAELRTFLIDRSGLTFFARVNNIVRYPRGNIGGWGASIDTVGLDIVSSSLESGRLVGNFMVPIGDSTSRLEYSAILARADTGSGVLFTFNVRPRDTLRIPLWVARMNLNPTSFVRITAGTGRSFMAQANFSGRISVTGDANGIPLSFSGIRFENFLIQTTAPYVSCGSFSFASPQHGFFNEDGGGSMNELLPASYTPDPEAMYPYTPMPPPQTGGGSSSSSGQNGGMSGFPVSISNIGIASGTRDRGRPGLGIRFTISVNLQPGSNAISGGTTLSVWGALETEGGPMRAVFDGVDLDSIGIRADMGAVEIEGSVAFYRRDPTFGTGFRGRLMANFVKMLRVEATMQFGAKPIRAGAAEEFRYWYVDARATLSSGIMIFSGVGIYGFGGGAWYNMVRETPSSTGSGLSSGDRALLTGSGSSAPAATPGSTASGTRYVPSYSASGETFGFYGMITVGTYPTADAFNCDVRLEVSFAGGAIREIRLRGDGYMLAGINNRAQAKVTMIAEISYNFPDRIFNGLFDVRINAGVVTGGGRMVMYFSPTTWHIKIGDPEAERVTINLLDIIQVQAYMMCGMNLPNTVRVPREITEVIAVPPPPRGLSQLQRGDGFAFGASCSIPPGPNPLEAQFLIFYASLKFFAGFDFSLLNYGPNASCANTGGAMGINGWYAMGQMYARVDASIGLFVDLWFVQGRFEILGLRAAAYIAAGLPNPSWMQGAVGGEYRILGGAIRGNCQFQFSIGEECRPLVESGTAGIDWYNEISPNNGATDVSIFVQPSVAANLPIQKPFYLEEPDGNGGTRVKIYRLKTRVFSLQRAGGAMVDGSSAVNSRDASYVTMTPTAQLAQRTQYTATYTAFAQSFNQAALSGAALNSFRSMNDEQRLTFLNTNYNTDANWSNVTYQTGDRRGQQVERSIASTFTTETLPDSIRPQEVALSYPRNRQRFFLQDECRNGTISLLNNRADLFPTGSGMTRYEYVLRFVTLPGNQRMETPFSYSPSAPPYYIGETRTFNTAAESRAWMNRGGAITFDIPQLANNQLYAVQIIRRRITASAAIAGAAGSFVGAALGSGGAPRAGAGGLAGGVGALSSGLLSSIRGSITTNLYSSMLNRYRSSVIIEKKSITGFDLGRTVEDNEKLLYLMFFKTSRHNTLRQKLATLTNGTTSVTPATWNLQILKTSYTGAELFDPFDVEYQTVELGTNNVTNTYPIPALITYNAWSRTSQWHRDYVNPMIYEAIDWMRYTLGQSRMMSRRRTYWEDAIQRNETFMDAPATERGISDGEISSVANPAFARSLTMMQRLNFSITTTRSGSGIGISGGSVTRRANQWDIDYVQPAHIGFLDFGIARTSAARLVASYCGGGDVGFDARTCARLRQIATQTWRYPESIRPSRYDFILYYNYCRDPDAGMNGIERLYFTY